MEDKNHGYIVKHNFLQDSSRCEHILVQTSRGHLFVIEIPSYEQRTGILTSKLYTSITSQDVVYEYIKTQSHRVKICFLSHVGLDLHHIYGYSLLYKDPRSDAPRLQIGEKFVIPVVYIRQEELKSEMNDERLRHFVENDEHLTVFYDMLKKSHCENLLDASGPYMLFAPDNNMLEKAYGTGGKGLKSKTMNLDIIVCSYFAPGQYDRDFTGVIPSITGQELHIKSGILQIPDHETRELKPAVFAKNGIMTVITSTGVIIPKKHDGFIVPNNLNINVTISEIDAISEQLLDLHYNYANKVKSTIKNHLVAMIDKLDQLDDVMIVHHKSKNKISNDVYFEHIKIASSLLALQNNVESLTRSVKNL